MKENKVLKFFSKTLNGMAYGLFATLIVGTIFSAVGMIFKSFNNQIGDFLYGIIAGPQSISTVLKVLTGAGIGIGVAFALEQDALKTIVLGIVGEIAAFFSLSTSFITDPAHPATASLKIGDPLTIYLVVIATALIMKLVLKKKTPVDIILVPLFSLTVGLIFSLLIRYPSIYVTYAFQYLINAGTNAAPILMGIVVTVLMGMALTAPISSAAIAAIIFSLPDGMSIAEGLTNPSYRGLIIASGASVVGCCTQMLGFAIQSRKDNNIGMILSIGVGTSMLQFKNILRKPIIWLPTIIASAIIGPFVTTLFNIYCIGSNAGMGTSGLVGIIGTFFDMGFTLESVIKVLVFELVLPLVLVFGIDLLFRKFNLIKDGDFKV